MFDRVCLFPGVSSRVFGLRGMFMGVCSGELGRGCLVAGVWSQVFRHGCLVKGYVHGCLFGGIGS